MRLLTSEGLICELCTSLPDLCSRLRTGAGAAIVSEESLHTGHGQLAEYVSTQPVWSDLPIVVLSKSGAELPALAAIVATLGNVSVLERPVRMSTLTSIVRSALRARERQYQVRDQLLAREHAEAEIKAGAERLKLAVQTGKLGVWTVDLNSRTMTCSATCKANFGRPADADFTYEDLWKCVHPDDVDRVQVAVKDCIAGRSEYEIEYRKPPTSSSA
jgi:PAS domain-containing protein